MEDKTKKQLDFLLADFQSAKSEIIRRSNLQRIALALLLSLYAYLGSTLAEKQFNHFHIVFLWASTLLGFIYYDREAMEISRLGLIIRERIAKPVGYLLGVKAENIIPTEVHGDFKYPTNMLTKRYDFIFKIIIFLGIPISFSLYFIIKRYC